MKTGILLKSEHVPVSLHYDVKNNADITSGTEYRGRIFMSDEP
jgi:hypothetical protein